jgi:pyruvate formate lyase activating enzyme
MQIAAVQPMTLLDYPKKLAAIVWTPGCNLRCGYCHNPELVLPAHISKNRSDLIPETAFFNFLAERSGKLDGVVICGGEPTLHADLGRFVRRIKDLGFLVKLDTNGSHPGVLRELFDEKLLDYVAMDIKHELHRYGEITPGGADAAALAGSIALIIASGVDYEFRTTVINGIHDARSVENIARTVAGCRKYTIQNFRTGKLVDPEFGGKSFFRGEIMEMKAEAEKWVGTVGVAL